MSLGERDACIKYAIPYLAYRRLLNELNQQEFSREFGVSMHSSLLGRVHTTG